MTARRMLLGAGYLVVLVLLIANVAIFASDGDAGARKAAIISGGMLGFLVVCTVIGRRRGNI